MGEPAARRLPRTPRIAADDLDAFADLVSVEYGPPGTPLRITDELVAAMLGVTLVDVAPAGHTLALALVPRLSSLGDFVVRGSLAVESYVRIEVLGGVGIGDTVWSQSRIDAVAEHPPGVRLSTSTQLFAADRSSEERLVLELERSLLTSPG